MNNEEKIKAWCEYDSNNMDMYELIVAGEREKMQGVDCWVSWGVNELYGAQPQLSASEPTIECKPNGDVSYIQQNHDFTGLGLGIVGLFNISPGQCKKFRIVEVGNE